MLLLRITIFFFLLLNFYNSFSQSSTCYPNNPVFYRQRDIDDFAKDHPGCTCLLGDLVIEEEYEGTILNLEGLSQLTKVEGYIWIYENHALTSLDGLQHIDTVGSGIYINSNPELTDVNGIRRARILDYGLSITENDKLEEIGTLLYVDTIEGIIIRDNPKLLTLSGFSNVKHIAGGCTIENNKSLVSMQGLDHLESAVYIHISGDSNLVSLEGLEHLKHVGSLTIEKMPQIMNLDELDSLVWINRLTLEENSQLNSIDELTDLVPDSLNYITIIGNPQLSACQIEPICQRLLKTKDYPEIEENGPGCNSYFDLIEACGLNSVCPKDLVLKTQEDVDRFPQLYPGCDTVFGDLILSYSTISNLDGLAQLKHIGGRLYLHINSALTSIEGLQNVTSIGGEINLYANENLESIAGLRGLHEIQNGFSFVANDAVRDLSNLEMFSKVTGNVYIAFNDSLNNISAMSTLRHVEGDLNISKNPALLSLTGLDNLEHVKGTMVIRGNFENLFPLASLDTVDADLAISECHLLEDLSGMANLTSVGSLNISKNNALLNLNGLPVIQTLPGKIQIVENPAMISLSGLSDLQQVGGEITIEGNASLEEISAFHQLTTANGIVLKNNAKLSSLDGFQNLEVNNGNLYITQMPGLINLHGFEKLQTIGGYLLIISNDSLKSLFGLEQVKQVGNNLIIKSNKLLNSLNGIANLESIGGLFTIEDCGVSLIGDFSELQSIGGPLTIYRNPNLTLVEGFNQITGLEELNIHNNSNLAAVEGFAALSWITGLMEIKNNDKLLSIPTFDELTVIEAIVNIQWNAKLARVDFLRHVERTGHLQIDGIGVDTLFCPRLKEVGGVLRVVYCPKLKAILMDSLEYVWSDFAINNNSALINLGSFQSLTETGGDLEINSNNKLLDIEALSSLHRFNGRLSIYDNRNLMTIEGLRNVDRSSFYVPGNNAYQNLFSIVNNDSLSACATPAICEILGEPATAYSLNSNHNGCNNRTEIQAHCGLANSCLPDSVVFDSQASIDAFPSLYPGCSFVLGTLIIDENLPGDILNLDSLAQITRIGGDLVVRHNAQLTDLEGLDYLRELGRSLQVTDNAALSSLMALDELPEHQNLTEADATEEFMITGNPNLSACSIPFVCATLVDPYKKYSLSSNLNGCNTVPEIQENCDYPTDCEFGYVSSQSDLERWRIRHPKCRELTEGIEISSFSSVYDMTPLDQIESVDGYLLIQSDHAIESLHGLENLRRLNGPIIITGNAYLEDISALSQLDPSSVHKSYIHLKLSGNGALSDCAIESICQLVENPEITTDIANNGNTCKTREEILLECTVGVLIPRDDLEILIYPNPAQDEILIESSADLQQEVISVSIANMNGMILSTTPFTSTLDVSTLPSGLYVLILRSRQHGLLVHRFLKN